MTQIDEFSPAPQTNNGGEVVKVILDAAKWIIENREDIGRLIAEGTKGVTNVRRWTNNTGGPVEVFKYDGGGVQDRYTIAKGRTIHADMWIPWCTKAAEFGSKHSEFHAGGTVIYVWQDGPYIRFNTLPEWVPQGQVVPGSSGAGGDRHVTFDTGSGNLGFVFMAV